MHVNLYLSFLYPWLISIITAFLLIKLSYFRRGSKGIFWILIYLLGPAIVALIKSYFDYETKPLASEWASIPIVAYYFLKTFPVGLSICNTILLSVLLIEKQSKYMG